MNENMQDMVTQAMRKAWQLGQTYWQQADSDCVSQHKKSAITQQKFEQLVDETRAAMQAQSPPPLTDEQILSELSRHYCPPNEPGNSLLERVYPGDLVKAVRAIIAQARGEK